MTTRLRVATYNIHKCRGLDRRVRPERIAAVLREVNADIVGLQEVLSESGLSPRNDQPRYLAETLGLSYALGENRLVRGASYGNVVLSRYPLQSHCNYDLSVGSRERRGCLRTDVLLASGYILHVFNLHLGTSYFERRRQSRLLMDSVLESGGLEGPRIVLGDFNEWTRGLASRSLSARFHSVEIHLHLNRSRTYPGMLPFLHLDHIYYHGNLELESLSLHRTRTALIASDHLPLVADFRLSCPL